MKARTALAGVSVIVFLCAGCLGREDTASAPAKREEQPPESRTLPPPKLEVDSPVRKPKAGRNYGVSPNKLTAKQAIAKLEAENDPFWINAKEKAYRSVKELLAQEETERRGGQSLRKLRHGDYSKRQIALTFDDGPHPSFTPKILSILKSENITATFFVVGTQAEKHENLIKAEADSGNLVGNHTFHHVSLTKIPLPYVAEEIEACGELLERILGKRSRIFRPPGGDYDADIARITNNLGYTVVLWTADPLDFSNPGAQKILSRSLERAGNGGILLLHDGVQQTVDILPRLIKILKSKGFEFVTVDRFIQNYPDRRN